MAAQRATRGGRLMDEVTVYGTGWRRRGWPAADANEAFIAVVRAHHFTQLRVADALKPFDLTVPTYGVLTVLALAVPHGVTMTLLAKSLLLRPTRLTYLVDRLEDDGHAERVARPKDRRNTLVRITEAGEDLRHRATEAVAATSFGFYGFEEDELHAVSDALAGVPPRAPWR
jgi:DNA-binding MarR family transcriptional regulator